MTPALDRERLRVLRALSGEALAADCFPAFRSADITGDQEEAARLRVLMVLIAAEEAGVPLIDALNYARFDENGLSFSVPEAGPDATVSLTEVARNAERITLSDAGKATVAKIDAEKAPPSAAPKPLIIPAGYTPDPKPLADASVGELAVFFEEALLGGKKDHAAARSEAWRVLGEKIPKASALDLGKLTRWILHEKHQPDRRDRFRDVLTVAEARIEALSKGIPQ